MLLNLFKSNFQVKKIIVIKIFWYLCIFIFSPVGFIIFILIRIIKPLILIRIQLLISERIGHFSGNTELYLCELDAGVNKPKGRFIDIWYNNYPICNYQLNRMIKRKLHVFPTFLFSSVNYFNTLFPGGDIHRIGDNSANDRDVHNLLDQYPAHIQFTEREEKKGLDGLLALGIEKGSKFICLHIRDDSYLKSALPWRDWSYHDYRNCNIQNYGKAALELAEMGYYVIRMGVKVKEPLNVFHPKIIDYSYNGLRSDFMDIYLGAKCEFCISNGTGFDGVPYIFRRPILYVDHVPIGIISTFSDKFLITVKKHWSREKKRFLTIQEIFEMNAAYYMSSREDGLGIGVDLYESTPEEIKSVVLEMESRVRGSWKITKEDEDLQKKFWKHFQKVDDIGNVWHGEIRAKIGSDFLRSNIDLLR